MRDPSVFHRRSDELEDVIKQKLKEAEKLIDEALRLAVKMRQADKMATYLMSDGEINPFEYMREKRQKPRRRKE